jgi:hypothetical protein
MVQLGHHIIQTTQIFEMFAITIDKFSNKWIGTRFSGLSKFNGSTWTTYNMSNSNIQSNSIYSLDADTLGNIWVGAPYSGLSKFNGTTWVNYTTLNSPLPDNDIYSLKYNKVTNSMWIGTASGIAVLNLSSNTWTIYNSINTPNFPGDYIRGITHSSSTGKTYIATGFSGIGAFDGSNWISYNTTNSNLPSNSVWALVAGNFGKVWAATYGGGIVSMVDSNTIQTPNSCNAVFTDNFSNVSGWVFNSNNSVTISNGSLNFNNSVNGQYNNVYKSLGTTLSDNNWKAEFTFELTNLNSTSTMGAYAIALTAGNQDFMTNDASGGYIETNQDALAVIGTANVPGEHDVNKWFFLMEDKKGNVRNWNLSTGIHMNPSILKYYLRFERVNGNTTKLSVFSDSLFTTHVIGSPQTYNINASITGLNTIQHGASTPGSPSRILNAKIDNDFICSDSTNIACLDSLTAIADYDAPIGYHNGSSPSTANFNYGYDAQNAAYAVPSAFGSGLNVNRALLHFDLSSIPANATIISAKLDLYSIVQIGSSPAHFGTNNNALIERVTGSWTENNVTWNNQPNTTSTNNKLLIGTNTASQDYLNLDITNMINDIQSSNVNNGIMLKLISENATNLLSFCSKDHPNAAKHPRLKITYTCQSTPSSLNQGDFTNGNSITFYPNPTISLLHLKYNLTQYKNASFQLYDIQGKLVYQTELNMNDDKSILTLDKLDNGLYFGKIYADGILVKTEKIVKSN